MTLSPDARQAKLNELYEYSKSKGTLTYKDIMDRLIEMDMEPDQLDKVLETLEELAKRYRLFIVSNSQQGYPELVIEKMGLRHLIQGHLCYGDTLTGKGQTILRLMKEHDISSAIYIGDTQGDYLATREAGIPFIFAAFGLGQAESWEAKIDQFEDLLKLL